MAETDNDKLALELAADLTIAWLSNPGNRASADEVVSCLLKMHEAVSRLLATQDQQPEPAPEYIPAVSVRRSLASKDHIISLLDGKPYKTLRRHLARHGLTPEQYRERYNLPADYPMVAQSYSERRSELAKKVGLGKKPKLAAADAKSTKRRKAVAARAR